MWTKADEERRLCNQWLAEPLINPETGLAIERDGPTFNDWKNRCIQLGIKGIPKATRVMSWRKCQEWLKNPDINPDTGREIKKDGPTWKWLEKECKCVEKNIDLWGEYYVPDSKGMVPAVIDQGRVYVVRTFEGRRIWGPLNKPAKGVKLCYYADSWDYRKNYYKPIFINGPTPRRPERESHNTGKGRHHHSNSTFYSILKPKHQKKKENPKKIVDTIVDLFISKN